MRYSLGKTRTKPLHYSQDFFSKFACMLFGRCNSLETVLYLIYTVSAWKGSFQYTWHFVSYFSSWPHVTLEPLRAKFKRCWIVYFIKVTNLTRSTEYGFTIYSILFSSINCLTLLYVYLCTCWQISHHRILSSLGHLLLNYFSNTHSNIIFNLCCIFEAASLFRFLHQRPECIFCGQCFFLTSYSFI